MTFSWDELNSIADAATEIGGGSKFRLVTLSVNAEPRVGELDPVLQNINGWIKGHSPIQGWSQHVSELGWFDEQQEREWSEYSSVPIQCELLFSDSASGLIRHVGGYKWICTRFEEADAKDGDKKILFADDFEILAKPALSNISHMLYTRYWGDEDGALTEKFVRFRGFKKQKGVE